MLGFVAESAEFSQGKFIFHGIRVDFAPSETPHISLLGNSFSKNELDDHLQEVSTPLPALPQVQILDESTELEEKQNSEEDRTDIDEIDEMVYEISYEDDGGLMSMDLSE